MRIGETFMVTAPPQAVFDFMTDPANLQRWQTSKTRVEPITAGPPRQGYRIREWTKPKLGREFEQVVEFTEFDPPRRLHVHIVEGPFPVDGTWVLSLADTGTQVRFTAEGELPGPLRLATPLVQRILAREFAGYHRNLVQALNS